MTPPFLLKVSQRQRPYFTKITKFDFIHKYTISSKLQDTTARLAKVMSKPC